VKPENILIEDLKTMKVKLSDLGSAIFAKDQHLYRQPLYIQSRFYRAPEILLSTKEAPARATSKIDIWGLGCVLGELYLNRNKNRY
jgi:serine/threonine protein kinase